MNEAEKYILDDLQNQIQVPETFLTGNIEGKSKSELIADAFMVNAMIHANSKNIPEWFFDSEDSKSYGFTMAKIGGLIGCDPTSDKAFEIAKSEQSAVN